jgi:hypothetical protein
MKKLLKFFELNSDMQYFEMIADNFKAGKDEDARTQFKAMPKQYRILFTKSALTSWGSGIRKQDVINLIDLI